MHAQHTDVEALDNTDGHGENNVVPRVTPDGGERDDSRVLVADSDTMHGELSWKEEVGHLHPVFNCT